jgi:hypothetical protein
MSNRARAAAYVCAAVLLCAAGCDALGGKSEEAITGEIPLAVPEKPTATPGNEKLNVKFTTVATATGYEIWYGTGKETASAKKFAGAITVAGRLVSAEITGLRNGITYYVWTKAVYEFGVSGFSEPDSAEPLPPPPAPSGLIVQSSDRGQLELSWSPVSGAESYGVYYSASANAPGGAGFEALEPAFLLTGLNTGSSYYVWITAKNTAGESAYSPRASGLVSSAGSAPGTPVISVKSGDARLAVSWQAVRTAASYVIYAAESGGGIAAETEIPAAMGTVTGQIGVLENEKSYSVWVKAKNSAGLSGSSAVLSEIPHAKRPVNFNNVNFVVGKAAADFSAGGDRGWRKKETSIGNLFTDSVTWYMRREYPNDNVAFTLLPARIVASGMSKGDITVGRLRQVQNTGSYGYDWSCTLVTLTGQEVIRLFAAAADVAHNGGGGHPTGAFGLVSKEVQHTIDYTTGSDNTHGITAELTVNGDVLVQNRVPTSNTALLSKSYRIATCQYLLEGIDDYGYYDEVYANIGANANVVRTGIYVVNAMIYYVYSFDAPLAPVLDGRIKLIGGVPIP